MPIAHFELNKCTKISELKPGASIHVIGVAGVAMAQLAIALSERGFKVSGSDKEFYEPTGSLLRESAVNLKKGYLADNITSDIDLVVIGNAVSYGHPEVEKVEQLNIAYTIFPKVIHELLISGKHSIVVSGTHGKTTTSALLAFTLDRLGRNPSYFFGGVVPELPRAFCSGEGGECVIEGDEYDSAFFAKVAKFNFYAPKTWIITSIEFDHADIYDSVESIEAEFEKLVQQLDESATLVCCSDSERLYELAEKWKSSCSCNVVTYGTTKDPDYWISERRISEGAQTLTVKRPAGDLVSFNFSLPGLHNARNACAAFIACELIGAGEAVVASSFAEFSGVKRRQELRFSGKYTLIEDFAHHPTAVRETIFAIREQYPDRRLWTVFEPRSNTSRKNIFQRDYIKAFTQADRVVLSEVATSSGDSEEGLLNVEKLGGSINQFGTETAVLSDADGIFEFLQKELEADDVILVMSNGSFGGLIENLSSWMESSN